MTAEFTPTSRPPVSDALISVVLPVYNESAVLPELCRRLRAALTECRTTYEIIFVNDGSRDNSATLLDRLARQFSEVRIVHLSRNFGHQAAIHAGLEQARGDAVVIMDADLQDPPEAIGRFLEAWQSGSDVVYAIHVARKESFFKRALFAGFHRMLASISRTPIPVDAGNFGLVDARVAQIILALGEQDRYFPGLRSWTGFKQTGLPVERGQRYDGAPRVSLRGLVRLAKTAIFSFSTAPLAIFTCLGAAALVSFFSTAGLSLYLKLFSDAAVPAWTSHLMLASFFTALNALGISVLGEYIVRIYDQVRNRPLYLVDRTVNSSAQESAEGEQSAEDRIAAYTTSTKALELDRIDPLEIDSGWDNAYQHLLDQAQGLLELGALGHSEAADLAERNARQSAGHESLLDLDAATPPLSTAEEKPSADGPCVLKLSETLLRR